MIRTSRMLSIKIPAAIMNQEQADRPIEIVVLEPPGAAPKLVIGSRILSGGFTRVTPESFTAAKVGFARAFRPGQVWGLHAAL